MKMNNIKLNESDNIRLVITAISIAEYGLMSINGKQELKMKINNAISSCRKVQDYFITHPNATQETKNIFKQEFLSDEIVLLTELLRSCFTINAEGIEQIIQAIKNSQDERTHDSI